MQPFGVMDDTDVAFLNDPNGDFIEMGEEVGGESDDEDELQSESTEDLDSNDEQPNDEDELQSESTEDSD